MRALKSPRLGPTFHFFPTLLLWTKCFVVSWVLLPLNSTATSNPDSLRQILAKTTDPSGKIELLFALGDALLNSGEIEPSLQAAREALVLGEAVPSKLGKANFQIAKLLAKKGHFDSSAIYLTKAEQFAAETNDDLLMGRIYKRHGQNQRQEGRLAKACESFGLAIKWFQQSQALEEQAKVLLLTGQTYIAQSNNDSALHYLKASVALSDSILEQGTMGQALQAIAIIHSDRGESIQALHVNHQVIDLFQSIGDHRSEALAYINIGAIYGDRREHDLALEYYQKAFNVVNDAGLDAPTLLGGISDNIGFIHQKEGRYAEALKNGKLAEKYYRESGNWQASYGLSFCLINIGETHRLKGNLEKASDYFHESLELSKRIEFKEAEAWAALGMSQVAWAKRQEHVARKLGESGYQLSRDLEHAQLRKEFSAFLSKIFVEQGNFEKAYEYERINRQLSDSLFNSEHLRKITELELEYQFDKEKQDMILLQEKKELILQNELKRRKTIQYALTGGALLLAGMLISLYRFYVKKRLYATQMKISRDKIELLSNDRDLLTHMIAHDMKNALNAIIGYAESEPFNEKMFGIHQSGSVILALVNNMLDTQKFEESGMNLHLGEYLVTDIIETARRQVALQYQQKSQQLVIRIHQEARLLVDKDILVRVLVNLLGNAHKYSGPGSIVTIEAQRTDTQPIGTYQITVTDQGEGIPSTELPYIFEKYWKGRSKYTSSVASNGLGLTFCKLAVEGHGGKITATSAINEGTTIKVELKAGKIGVMPAPTDGTPIQDPLILDNEKSIITRFQQEMAGLEVSEISKLDRSIKEMRNANIQSRWRRELENAVYSGNAKKFRELIEND